MRRVVVCLLNLTLFGRFRCRRRLSGGSLSNDDGDGNENVKKTRDRLNRQNNNFVSTSRFLVLYVYLLSLHDYDVKNLISRFMEDVNKRRRIFLSLFKLKCGLQEIRTQFASIFS